MARNVTFLGAYADWANGLTAFNAALGVLSVSAALAGNVLLAAALIVAAHVVDHLDGWVARRYGAANPSARQFGGHLDTLADVVDFSVAPAVALIVATGNTTASVAVALLFVIAGVGRLAHFEIVGAEGGRRYAGLPTTYAAYLGAIALVLVDVGLIAPTACLVLFSALALLQVANITILKPSYPVTLGLMPVLFAALLVFVSTLS
jgi:CDP-diacylglycerol--serine O-phosphatidyltransferase